MTTVALKMLCVLLCAVFASAEVMPMTDFDLEKVNYLSVINKIWGSSQVGLNCLYSLQMGGKWYLIGISSNAKWFVSHKADMKMGTAMLVPKEGDLDLAYANLK